MGLLLLSLFATGISASKAANQWNHGWATAGSMTFADFNSNTLLTDAQAADAAAKFRIISLEKCSGVSSGVTTEEAIYATAQQLKAKDPTAKVLFYLATDQQGIRCYGAYDEFMAHPEWHMKLDNGSAVSPPILDPTVRPTACAVSFSLEPRRRSSCGAVRPLLSRVVGLAAVLYAHSLGRCICTHASAHVAFVWFMQVHAGAAWWASVPLGGINGTGMYKGTKVSTLIDGVSAPPPRHLSIAMCIGRAVHAHTP